MKIERFVDRVMLNLGLDDNSEESLRKELVSQNLCGGVCNVLDRKNHLQ